MEVSMLLLQNFLTLLLRDKKGATAVEYGLMVALIAVAIIAAVLLLGGNLATLFNLVANCLGNLAACNAGP
jgi:pilus assembly protein Flp/PilA